jgi:hypothetical protein
MAEDVMSHRICLLAAWILLGVSAPFANAQPGPNPSGQHFICSRGFTFDQCRNQMAVLRRALDRYPVADLGKWSWVLVRTTDWKRILFDRGYDSTSPAFTSLPGKETFFDDALTTPESVRGIQLMEIWRMPVEELLDKAVRHELAHALCSEKDESKARAMEERLRSKAPLVCRAPRT